MKNSTEERLMNSEFDTFLAELVELLEGDAEKAAAFMASWAGTRLYIPNGLIRQRDITGARKLLKLGVSRSEIRGRLMAAGYSRDVAYDILRRALRAPLAGHWSQQQ